MADLTYFERDANVLDGKLRLRGTRLSVDLIFELLESGWTEQQLLENYPSLTDEALRAVFALARESLSSEQIVRFVS